MPSGLPPLIPPTVRVRLGRPRKEKMSLENIIWASRQGATVTCGKCMQPGHNARTHKNGNTPRFIQSQQVPHSSTVSIPGSSSSQFQYVCNQIHVVCLVY
ncbi:hypothetical protein Droror1_Dr00016141 [Drosera rotundifolia]